jgi:hypothetical protein
VVDYLNAHYDGRQELLMESNGNEIIAFYEPANELIYEGTYQRWGQALHDPTGHNIRWIVARCGGSPDLVCTTDGRHQLSNYNRVFMTSDGVYRVYEIK